jgi:ribosomal protein S18 acetylase RimI-like enzyme
MYLSVEDDADPQDVETVGHGLQAFNLAHTGTDEFERVNIFLRGDDGTIQGGLLGELYWGWLHISILWLHEDMRGQGYGQQLVRMAEDLARERGYRHAHLDTMSFQALGFYRKLGYEEFGRLEDIPPGHSRIFLQKTL